MISNDFILYWIFFHVWFGYASGNLFGFFSVRLAHFSWLFMSCFTQLLIAWRCIRVCPTYLLRRRSGESAKYKWTRANGRELPKGHEIVDYNRRLIIHNVKTEDEGEYTCTASAQQSSSSKSVTLSISGRLFLLCGAFLLTARTADCVPVLPMCVGHACELVGWK